MTNFEKLKQMSVEDFADWATRIADGCYNKGQGYSGCRDCPLSDLNYCSTLDVKEWLESEVETE